MDERVERAKDLVKRDNGSRRLEESLERATMAVQGFTKSLEKVLEGIITVYEQLDEKSTTEEEAVGYEGRREPDAAANDRVGASGQGQATDGAAPRHDRAGESGGAKEGALRGGGRVLHFVSPRIYPMEGRTQVRIHMEYAALLERLAEQIRNSSMVLPSTIRVGVTSGAADDSIKVEMYTFYDGLDYQEFLPELVRRFGQL